MRLDSMDGLRGWASVMVVLSHLWGQFARHVTPFYENPLLDLISDGHIAVLVFFVLSGVALSLRFTGQPQRVSLPGLVAARYVRLVVPILATTLIVFALVKLGISGQEQAGRTTGSDIFFGARSGMQTSLWDAVWFSLYTVLFDYEEATSFNTSLWTMPVEFRGSLLIFGLVFVFSFLPRLERGARFAGVLLVTAALLLLSKQLAGCFTAGYVLAELVRAPADKAKWARPASAAFLVLSAAAAWYMGEHDDSTGSVLAIGLVMAALFWPAPRRFLSNGLSRWLGQVSFPLYLIHVPVIGSMGILYWKLVESGISREVSTHVTVLVAFLACFAAARLLLPVEHLSIRWSRAAGAFASRRKAAKPNP